MSSYPKTRRRYFAARRILPAIAMSWIFVACSTAGPAPDPQVAALHRGQKVVSTGIEEGFDKSEDLNEFIVDARRNPCQCDAPDDEIRVHGRWTRVYLSGEETLLTEFSAQMSAAADRHEFHEAKLLGAFSGTQRSNLGIEFPVFRLQALLN